MSGETQSNASFSASTTSSGITPTAQNSLWCALSKPALLERREEGWRQCPSAWGTYIYFEKVYRLCLLSQPSTPTFFRLRFLAEDGKVEHWTHKALFLLRKSVSPKVRYPLGISGQMASQLLSSPPIDPRPTLPPWMVAGVHLSGTGWVFPACLRFYGGNKNKEQSFCLTCRLQLGMAGRMVRGAGTGHLAP